MQRVSSTSRLVVQSHFNAGNSSWSEKWSRDGQKPAKARPRGECYSLNVCINNQQER